MNPSSYSAGNGHGDDILNQSAAPGNNDGERPGGGDSSGRLVMMQGAPGNLSTEEMMRLQQQQHQQQQQQQPQMPPQMPSQNHPMQLPMGSSGLQYQQLMAQAQSAEMNSAAQLLAAARMGGDFMGKDDPSSSMLRYQSTRPDLSPATMKQLTSPKQGDSSVSTAQQSLLASNQPPPFIFDGYAGWVCRHCSHLDHYYRGPNYVWMGGQQAPPNHFVEAHLKICPAINQPWQFGPGANVNANRAPAPLHLQNMMQQQSAGQQISVPKPTTNQPPLEASGSQQEKEQEHTRKRKFEATDPPSDHPLQGSVMNASDNMLQPPGMWRQQQSNFPQMFSQWQQGGMMGMPGMGGMGMSSGMASSGTPMPMYPPAPDPTGRSPMASHTMMQSSMGGGEMMPPPSSVKHPGVVHTGTYYAPQANTTAHFSPTKKRSTNKKYKSNISPKGIHSSDEAYARAVEFLRKKAEETSPLPTAPSDVTLIEEGDSALLTDYFYFIISQLAVCRLTEKDRKTRGGKRQDVAVGYGGLQCIHCATAPSARKFFWSNVDRLANSFAGIPDHVLTCKMCPADVTEALLVLKGRHNAQMSMLPRGSQKQFFRRMWKRLHAGDQGGVASSSSQHAATTAGAADDSLPSTLESDNAAETLKAAVSVTTTSRENLDRVSLAVAQDKDWLSDLDCFIREQVEVFCATSNDVKNAAEIVPIKPGQVGLRWIHSAKAAANTEGGSSNNAAVKYPHSVSGIYDSVQELCSQHLDDCPNLTSEMKSKMSKMAESTSASSTLRRYYVQAAGALGLFDSDEGGVRAGGRVIPMVGK